jgi:hypothetical protein
MSPFFLEKIAYHRIIVMGEALDALLLISDVNKTNCTM